MATLLEKKPTALRNGKNSRGLRSNPFPPEATLADVRAHLGGIPLSRIHLHPQPGTATISDLKRLDRKTRFACELIDGVIVEKSTGWYESLVATVLIELLSSHARTSRLGIVLGANAVLQLYPMIARAPDVSFVSKKSLARYKPSRSNPIPLLVPDLAIEVLSKSNTAKEIALKLQQYFSAGVLLVWVIDPKRRSAVIHTSSAERFNIDAEGVLDGGTVVPGFRVNLQEVFVRADVMLEDFEE